MASHAACCARAGAPRARPAAAAAARRGPCPHACNDLGFILTTIRISMADQDRKDRSPTDRRGSLTFFECQKFDGSVDPAGICLALLLSDMGN